MRNGDGSEMSRTEAYRKIAYENANIHKWDPAEVRYLVSQAVSDTMSGMIHNLRQAYYESYILDNFTVEINDYELLLGRYANSFMETDEGRAIMNEEKGLVLIPSSGGAFNNNATQHRVIDYEKLLKAGIKGLITEIDNQLDAISYSDSDAVEKASFYKASKMSLEAVCRFAKRYHSRLIEKIETENNPARKNELMVLADIFAKVPYEPCEHFYEALQCMWFVQFCLKLVQDITLTGRLDNYLYPYYKKDIESGYITGEFAFELIEQLYFKHNEIYNTWPSSIMIGGVDRAGNPVWNELSYMCINAIETTGLVNPSVAVCYTNDMPEDLLARCVELISKGYTRPSFFNDRVVREGLIEAGVSEEDARYYIHSTCVEITPIGCSNVHVATPYINLNKAFEYILGNKRQIYGDICHVERDINFDISDLDSFDKFYSLSREVAAEIIRTYLTGICEYMYKKHRYAASPLASAFIDNCLALGKDSGAGGAKYSFVYPCFPGFVNFVDILAAVKKAVYEDKVISLEGLSKLLSNNFDDKKMHQYLLNRCPKYGNDIDEVDGLAVDMYDFIRNELKKYKTSVGGTFHPSFFAWIMHGILGMNAAATPDGRRQGEALSENLGAMQGRDKNGPLSVMRSIAKIDQKYGVGGIATNFRFSKAFVSKPEGREAVKNFIQVFMDNGCFEIQFNVVDQKDLMEAKTNPDKYRTLLVRVAGYSDYFVNLHSAIQDEIIKRTEHESI